MLKLNRLAIILLTLISTYPVLEISSQQRTYSPLSRFGIGEQQQIGFNSSSAMGYTGIATRSSYGLNNLNPASLTALDSLSFYFEGGISHYWQEFSYDGTSARNSDMVFDYIALGFSVSPKFSSTIGFKPITSSGYDYENVEQFESGEEAYSQLFGSGNVTQAYFGIAYQPLKSLSIGANIGYNFGSLQNTSKATFSDPNALKHGVYRETRVSSITYDFGIQYEHKLSEEKSITIGTTFRPKLALSGDTTRYVARGTTFGDNNNLFQEGTLIDTLAYAQNEYTGADYEYAASWGFGLSYKIENKLNIALDYQVESWADVNFLEKNIELQNSHRYAIGAEFIPNDRSAKSYLARIRYRAGAFYKNESIVIDDHDLYNYGITFGVGLPLKRSKTAVNIAMEFGTRDAKSNNSVSQTYGKVIASFSLHEFWFVKRKFD
ncbi:hypothetical protein E9993_02025 [Labilibacter sediminis]|nr:hypothetical protein E9993_02025 [Labilibacter sediminis]